MATKSITKMFNQVFSENDNDDSLAITELTPEEAEELAGGLDGACNNNYSCPTSNTSCPAGPKPPST